MACPDVLCTHLFLNKSLTESKAFKGKPLVQYYMVSLRKEVWRKDPPWGMLIVYADSEHDVLQVTAYRLAKLEFPDEDTAFYAKYLSTKYIMLHFLPFPNCLIVFT